MADQTTKLDVHAREAAHSRETRRLRRSGQVPGVLYGGSEEPVSFAVAERTLRHALAAKGAVLELSVDGSSGTPAVLKDAQRHPVRGDLMHVDLLRVDLNVAIQATVAVHFVGDDKAPGVIEGGILEHVTRELTIEALPNDIPDSLQHDVSEMVIGDTLTLEALTPPPEVALLDDPETVIATLTPPRLQLEEDEGIEEETEVVGEGEGAQADAGGDEDGGEADSGAE
jgi:large subunit ribosomal protein L25